MQANDSFSDIVKAGNANLSPLPLPTANNNREDMNSVNETSSSIRILFVGDVVGKGGRHAVVTLVPQLRRHYDCSFVIVNGENSAGGSGFTGKCLRHMLQGEVDVFTGGDHMWDQQGFADELPQFDQVIRPANMPSQQPGRGAALFAIPGHAGLKLGVICLQGQTFMKNVANNPFQCADQIVNELRQQTPLIFVDMHAEATSEKIAMGRFLDGRVSAVLGTHTHVVTADEQIFPCGTAFQTDVGMVGARESILGRDIEPVLQRFVTGLPARFTVSEQTIRLHATVVECDTRTGHATHIERIVRDYNA